MFVTGRVARTAAAVLCALLVAGACSSGDDDPAPEPTGLIAATTMRGALLQAADIGPTWQPPAQSPDPNQLVSICGGTSTPPPVPPGGEVVAASFVDEGEKGAQTLDQTALVYGDPSAAQAAQAALRAVADGCKADVSVPATVNDEKSEPAYTETVEIKTLDESGWSGFVVIRHKKYEPKHPGTADTAVAVLSSRNVVLVDAYALYQLNNASTSPNFATDWPKLVGSVVQRVG
ncbi:hypothetical protein Ade02nite_18400 [Paractinoplanes deccanensis]|uniref:PknH-like extracellular domain-containing protein n=1 Tax=Paractinoplanes deccanensis TaxID=113561 RepID=A0ABQ3XZP7_9ACTN|nr:hypothetical protein [Actinoplanes deccanensis]GID73199.1 hypothetical protein Ade02nite_18400 [Actinoplanes deccanensis]